MKHEILKKSIVFRIYSVMIMAAFFYIVTGSFEKMTIFTVLVEAIKTAQYTIFEIGWDKYKNIKRKK